MLRIGDFSKICRVPVSALRYYADNKLLNPDHIDASTGYRYYILDQLPRLNRILALKDLGLSLASIRRFLDESISPVEIQGMLRLREAQLEQEVVETQMQLQRVRERLRQMEHELKPLSPDVVIRAIEAQTALTLRTVIADGQQVASLLGELFAVVTAQQISPTSPPMTIFHDAEFKEENLDVEIACPAVLPVATSFYTPDNRLTQMRILEAIPTAACTVHVGSYDLFIDTYTALGRWIERSGYRISGPPREIYLRSPAPNELALTEIQMPVKQKE